MRKDWRRGLVNAFPIPEDHRPGAKKKERAVADLNIEALKISDSEPKEPFPFLKLPSELRNRVYRLILRSEFINHDTGGVEKESYLPLLLTSKQLHDEAAYMLYTNHRFPLFPLQDFSSTPSVQNLAQKYQKFVTDVEFRVGSSWTAPPKSWRVGKTVMRCFKRLLSVQNLRIYVVFDPSLPIFEKFRISRDFYTDFCGELLKDVLKAMPQIEIVGLDGNPGVDVFGPLVSRLKAEALLQDKIIVWGSSNHWTQQMEEASRQSGQTI